MPEIKPRYKSGNLHDVGIIGASFFTCRFVDCTIIKENIRTDRYWDCDIVAGMFTKHDVLRLHNRRHERVRRLSLRQLPIRLPVITDNFVPTCAYCGIVCTPAQGTHEIAHPTLLTRDHVIPRVALDRMVGSIEFSGKATTVPCCYACNEQKGTLGRRSGFWSTRNTRSTSGRTYHAWIGWS